MGQIIAETLLFLQAPDGETKPIHIQVGCPYRISDSEAACPISMQGLYPSLPDLHGVDTFQALELVFKFVRQTIQIWETDRYSFKVEGDDDLVL